MDTPGPSWCRGVLAAVTGYGAGTDVNQGSTREYA